MANQTTNNYNDPHPFHRHTRGHTGALITSKTVLMRLDILQIIVQLLRERERVRWRRREKGNRKREREKRNEEKILEREKLFRWLLCYYRRCVPNLRSKSSTVKPTIHFFIPPPHHNTTVLIFFENMHSLTCFFLFSISITIFFYIFSLSLFCFSLFFIFNFVFSGINPSILFYLVLLFCFPNWCSSDSYHHWFMFSFS